jgi:hypothetical protein
VKPFCQELWSLFYENGLLERTNNWNAIAVYAVEIALSKDSVWRAELTPFSGLRERELSDRHFYRLSALQPTNPSILKPGLSDENTTSVARPSGVPVQNFQSSYAGAATNQPFRTEARSQRREHNVNCSAFWSARSKKLRLCLIRNWELQKIRPLTPSLLLCPHEYLQNRFGDFHKISQRAI